ncbi:MAG TPA: hypothetical protein VFE17_09270 [Candidatus Baltobacteraceae bacterium]|jgi:hypothetical protein|nr:hypothetical protein [Candidatus Baltobacteraceae bacterium]
MWKRRFALAAVLMLAACSSGQNQGNRGATPAPSLRNPLDVPLYPGASIMSVQNFTQKISTQNSNGPTSVFTAGNGTYSGHEVLAASDASFSDLSSWVNHLALSPPPGYAAVENGDNPNAKVQAQQYGIDYAAFKKKDDGKTRGVLVIVMDPQRVNARFGKILGMVAKYRALPQVMRAPIDNEAKARFGMTITEATQPESPIGGALSALDEFSHKDTRGIVVVDAVKQ